MLLIIWYQTIVNLVYEVGKFVISTLSCVQFGENDKI
jgi:hypothetical protein